MNSTLIEAFLAAADRFADKTALVGTRGPYTYREYAGAALAAAAALAERDEAEHVGLLLPTSEAFAVLFLGSAASGRIPVPLNFFLSPRELNAILRDSGVRTVYTVEPFKKTARELDAEVIFVEQWLPEALSSPPAKPSPPNEVATLLYTSGTTGAPKGVVLSQKNILSNVEACIEHVSFTSDHVLLGMLPLFHTFALTVTLLLPATAGATTLLMPRFDPVAATQAIAEHSVTMLVAVPSMYRAMLRTADQKPVDLSSLALPISGGEALPRDVFDAYRDRHGVTLLEGYGLTETSPVISSNTPKNLKPGTVGKPLANLEVRIVDDEGGDAGVNADGEVWVRGPSVMECYFKRPEETAAALTEGAFFKTGDIGRIDEEGFLSITGRKKEMIISAGENIFPCEIEHVLLCHPCVAEVAVVGVPHKMRGEAPKAFVVLKEGASAGEDELKVHCRERIARYKVPVEVEFCAEFPHSPMGKILKHMLVGPPETRGDAR
ncbi:MAG: class I adenylate-forming enzyme family protein [Planctomycetota bacterium]